MLFKLSLIGLLESHEVYQTCIETMDASSTVFTEDMDETECLETLKELYRATDWSVHDEHTAMYDFVKRYLVVSNDKWTREYKAKHPGQWETLQAHGDVPTLQQSISQSTSLQLMHTHLFDPDVRQNYRLTDEQLQVIQFDVGSVIQMEIETEDKKTISDLCHALCPEVFIPFAHTLQSQGDPEMAIVQATVAPHGQWIDVTYKSLVSQARGMVTNYITVKPKGIKGRRYEFIMPYKRDFSPILTFLARLRGLVEEDFPHHFLKFKGSNNAGTRICSVTIERYRRDEEPISADLVRRVFLSINMLGYGVHAV